MLTERQQRHDKLIAAGVTPTFLAALEDESILGKLQYYIQAPDGAYAYIPDYLAQDDAILHAEEITPICNGIDDEETYALLRNGQELRFVRFELEADEIYNDFGASFQRLLAHVLLDYVGFDEQMSCDDHIALGQRLGLNNAATIYHAYLAQPAVSDINAWQQAVLPLLLEQ